MAVTKEGLLQKCNEQAAMRDQLLAKATELRTQAQACEGARAMAAQLLRDFDEEGGGDGIPLADEEVVQATPTAKNGRTSRKPAEAVV